jgi:hypothetical protein
MTDTVFTEAQNGTEEEAEDEDYDGKEDQHEPEGSEYEDEGFIDGHVGPSTKRSKKTCSRNGTNTTKLVPLSSSLKRKSMYNFNPYTQVIN